MQIWKSFSLAAAVALLTSGANAQLNNQWVEFVKDTGAISAGTISNNDNETDMDWGDLDNDGWIDLVIVRKQPFTSAGRRTNILLMNENGVLTDRTTTYAEGTDMGGVGDQGFSTATNDRDVVITDVDGDGWLDVVTATTLDTGPKWRAHPRVYMNLGNSGGNWQGLRYEEARIPQLVHFGSGNDENPRFCSVAAGDLTYDGDGLPDLYFGDYDSGPGGQLDMNDRLLVNDGNGFFTDATQSRMTSEMVLSAFGMASVIDDMNGDGWNDVLKDTALNFPQRVSVTYNNPNNVGNFNLFDPFHTNAPYHVNSGDLNNDGRLDVVVSDDGSDRYRYNTGVDGLGRATWGTNKTFQFLSGGDDGFASNNMIVDLDRDGWRDAITADVDVDIGGYSRRMHIYHNPGGAIGSEITLREERQLASGNQGAGWLGAVGLLAADLRATHDFGVFDIDNDGDKDLIISRQTGTEAYMSQVDPLVFEDLGGSKSGVSGAPVASGLGSLSPNTFTSIDLTNAAPNAFTYLVIGVGVLNAPFKGGTMVPTTDIILPLGFTSPSGGLSIPFLAPPGVPNDAFLVWQFWIDDASNIPPFAASNGLRTIFYDLEQFGPGQ